VYIKALVDVVLENHQGVAGEQIKACGTSAKPIFLKYHNSENTRKIVT